MCSSFSQGQNRVLQPTLTVSAMALSHQSFLCLCLIPTISFTTSFLLSIWTWASRLHLLKKKKLIVPFWVSPLQSQDILYSLLSVLLNLWKSILHPLVLITSFLNIHQWLANHKAQLRMAGFCPADSTSPPLHPGALIPWFFWSCPVLSLILFTVFVRFSPLSPQISKNPCVNRKCYLIAWL